MKGKTDIILVKTFMILTVLGSHLSLSLFKSGWITLKIIKPYNIIALIVKNSIALISMKINMDTIAIMNNGNDISFGRTTKFSFDILCSIFYKPHYYILIHLSLEKIVVSQSARSDRKPTTVTNNIAIPAEISIIFGQVNDATDSITLAELAAALTTHP